METPDPPSDNPGVSKQVFLTPHDISRIPRSLGRYVYQNKDFDKQEVVHSFHEFNSQRDYSTNLPVP